MQSTEQSTPEITVDALIADAIVRWMRWRDEHPDISDDDDEISLSVNEAVCGVLQPLEDAGGTITREHVMTLLADERMWSVVDWDNEGVQSYVRTILHNTMSNAVEEVAKASARA